MKRHREEHTRMPSRRGHFLLGNMLAVQRDPTNFLLSLRSEYGDMARYPVAIWRDLYLFSHPEAVKHVLGTNQKNYSIMVRSRMMLKPIMGEGLLTNEGPSWLLSRRLMQPIFHRKMVTHFTELICQITATTLESWADVARRGKSLDIGQEMGSLTLGIVAKALFGADLETETFRSTLGALLNSLTDRLSSPWLPLLGVAAPKNREFRDRTRVLHESVNQIINKHRLMRRAERSSGSDWLEQLSIKLPAGQLRDEVITLLIAGHETTAMLLTWSFYLVASHPNVRERLTEEVVTVLGKRPPTASDLEALPYSKKILQEALRLYPPVWVMFRKALADDVVLGYSIPAGARITLSPFVTHRHPDYWHEPSRFKPSRFPADHPNAYFPFGGGARQCIGQHFAEMTAQLILVMVTQRYQLELTNKIKPQLEAKITLQPRGPICMIPLKKS